MWWESRSEMGEPPGRGREGASATGWDEPPGYRPGYELGDMQLGDMPCGDHLVTAVAVHEKLTPVVARHKVAAMLGESWGPPAIRQMIQDEIDRAANSGRWPNIDSLIDTYQWCCENLPAGSDRRTLPRPH